MSMTRNPVARDVLNQIVMDPRYAEVMRIPVFSMPQIMLAVGSLALFGSSTAIYVSGFIPIWLAVIANVIAVYLAFTPLHDASHRAVSSNGFLNDLIGTITGQLLLPGVNMPAFRTIHMDHHRYVGQVGRDPDTSFVNLPKPFGITYLMLADVHWALWYFKYGRHLWSRKAGIYIGLLLVCLVGSHVALLMSPWWSEFLLLYVVPQRLGLGLVAYTFAHIQHPHGLTWDKEPFQSTVFIRGESIFRRLMFGQEEHIIHHLTPHVPWFKYKRVWDLANGVLSKQGIPARGWLEGPGDIARSPLEIFTPRSLRVAEIRDLTANIRELRFEAEFGKSLNGADAGAHVDIQLSNGLVRQYTLLESSPTHYTIAVKREETGRGGSLAIHSLSVGDTVMVGKPRNNFVLYESAPRFVLVAGGIGITPMLAMARRLLAIGKPFLLHVCAKDFESIPYYNELKNGPLARHCRIHLDATDGRPSLNVGMAFEGSGNGAMLYLCGPLGFMNYLREQAQIYNWPKSLIRTESFSASLVKSTDLRPFTLRLGRSARTVEVGVDETAIDALAKIGVDVPFACMQGTCGTCITPVISGSVEHYDAFLAEEDKAKNDRMCMCVSRAVDIQLTVDL